MAAGIWNQCAEIRGEENMYSQKYKLFLPNSVLLAAFIYLCFFMPVMLTAEDLPPEKIQNRGRFRVEFFGGAAFLNPIDLNRIVDYDNSVQDFTYDAHFNYLRANNMIQSWSKNIEGERKKIKGALPFGIRIRYTVLDFMAVSIGFQYLQKKESETLDFNYTRNELFYEQYIESLYISPYQLSIKAYNPFIGIHFFKKLNRFLSAEGFILGGPLFAECAYESNWQYTWLIQGEGYTWLTYEANGLLAQDGSGTGIALEVGARLNVPVIHGFDIFLESGYAYLVVKSLSGSGREIQGESTETWEGDWKTKSEAMSARWGTLDLQFPTSFQTSGTGIEDFWLDLSGFRVKIGFSLGF